MSHLPERKEKNCLNCNTIVLGKFCHNCGQENIEPKQSLWHLLNHFFSDVTHFDGKFFSSLKLLITKPGFLSKQYMLGRREAYLNPVRMYLFTSAIFFLVFFSVLKNNIINVETTTTKDAVSKTDTAAGLKNKATGKQQKLDSAKQIDAAPISFNSKGEYDSLLKKGLRKDNWFLRQLIYKKLQLQKEYKDNPSEIFKVLVEKFNHSFPQLLFVLMPILAFILKLLYRKKRDYYYTDHLIFTLHIYIFVFIAILAIISINKAADLSHWYWLKYISGAIILAVFFYFYKSLQNFYGGKMSGTLLKYFIILISLLFIEIFLFSFFLFILLFQL